MTTTATPAQEAGNLLSIPARRLTPSPLNPRKRVDQEALHELAASIAAKGILQNLVARPAGNERYEVAAGSRRLQAVNLLIDQGRLEPGYELPCRILNLTDRELLEVALAENSERQDVDPLEEADGFAKLLELGATVADLAERFGRTDRFVRQRLALHDLVPDAREALEQGRMSLGVAREFANAPRRLQQEAIGATDWQGNVQTYRLRQLLNTETFPVDAALFDRSLYTGEILEDLFGDQPPRFADVEQARKLQAQAVDAMAKTQRDLGIKVDVVDPDWSMWADPRTQHGAIIAPLEPEIPPERLDAIIKLHERDGAPAEEIDDARIAAQEAHARKYRAGQKRLEQGGGIILKPSKDLTGVEVIIYDKPDTPAAPDESEDDLLEGHHKYSEALISDLGRIRTHALRRALHQTPAEQRHRIAMALFALNTINLGHAHGLTMSATSTAYSDGYRPSTPELARRAREILAGHLVDALELINEQVSFEPEDAVQQLTDDLQHFAADDGGTYSWPTMHIRRQHEPIVLHALLALPPEILEELHDLAMLQGLALPEGGSLGGTELGLALRDHTPLEPQEFLWDQASSDLLKKFPKARLEEIATEAGITFQKSARKGELADWILEEIRAGRYLPGEFRLEPHSHDIAHRHILKPPEPIR